MFNSNKDNAQGKTNGNGLKVRNIFASGTVIEGEIKSDGAVRVDGRIVGTLISKAKVVVTPGAIAGFITALKAGSRERWKCRTFST